MQATVRDAMSTDVVATTCHTSITDAERLLISHGVDELFIIDERGLLCGVVPDYELLKRRLSPCADQKTVEAIMSRRFLVIGADSPLTVAGRYLREHVHRRLAVVEERRLVGQLTRRAVLTWLMSWQTLSPCAENPNRAADDSQISAGPSGVASAAPPATSPSTTPVLSVANAAISAPAS